MPLHAQVSPGTATWNYATRLLTNPASALDLSNMLAGISPTASGRAANLDHLDAPISTAQADITDLLNRLTAARATKLDNLDTAISSRLAAVDHKQFTKGLTEHGALISRAYADLASYTYVDLLDVSGAGYLTGIWAVFYVEGAPDCDVIIEVDGTNVTPFTNHAANHGNIGTPGEAVCFETTWDANYKYVLMCTPMYRFDSSLKIRLYNTTLLARSIGARGNITYLME